MPRRALLGFVSVLVLAACSFGQTATTSSAPAGEPASGPAASPAGAPARAPAADAVRLTVVSDASEARFRAQEQLVGRNLPNEAVGVTRDVGGSLVFDPDGNLLSDQSRIIVDLRNLKSDESRRDNFIQRNTLQTSTYPTAEFVPTAAPGLTWPLPTSGSAQFQLTGPLTVHGVTQDALWQVNATFSETEIAGTSSTRVKLTDFGMAPPKAGPVLSVEDELTLEIDFRTAPGPV